MSSELKIEANRRNAQLSTGPKTPEGKAKVATNSCTHGLCSRNAILPEEDPAEFHALLAGLLSEFQPASACEESHVRELASAASSAWRLASSSPPWKRCGNTRGAATPLHCPTAPPRSSATTRTPACSVWPSASIPAARPSPSSTAMRTPSAAPTTKPSRSSSHPRPRATQK